MNGWERVALSAGCLSAAVVVGDWWVRYVLDLLWWIR